MSDVDKTKYFRTIAGLAGMADARYRSPEETEKGKENLKNGLKSLQEAISRPPKGKVVAFAYLQVEISEDGKQIMGIEGMSGPLLSLWYLAKALEAKIEGQIEKVAPSMCMCESCQIDVEQKLTAEFGQEVH